MALDERVRPRVVANGAVEVDEGRVAVGEGVVQDALDATPLIVAGFIVRPQVGRDNGLPLLQSGEDGRC